MANPMTCCNTNSTTERNVQVLLEGAVGLSSILVQVQRQMDDSWQTPDDAVTMILFPPLSCVYGVPALFVEGTNVEITNVP